jgi:hypothetical protein
VEAELTELLDLNQKQIEAMEAAQRKEDKLEDEASLDIYCTVDELREKASQFPALDSTFVRNSINKFDDVSPVTDKRDALQEISLNKVSLAELGCAFGLGTHETICWCGIHGTVVHSLCHRALNDISVRRVVGLFWVPRHAGIRGNEITDGLARGGSALSFCGPEPALGVSRRDLQKRLGRWLADQHGALW